MIHITAGVQETFTATADTLVQNTSPHTVTFQTDVAEAIWGELRGAMTLDVPDGTTVYFKANHELYLATIEI